MLVTAFCCFLLGLVIHVSLAELPIVNYLFAGVMLKMYARTIIALHKTRTKLLGFPSFRSLA